MAGFGNDSEGGSAAECRNSATGNFDGMGDRSADVSCGVTVRGCAGASGSADFEHPSAVRSNPHKTPARKGPREGRSSQIEQNRGIASSLMGRIQPS
jgi:hypothetical protein